MVAAAMTSWLPSVDVLRNAELRCESLRHRHTGGVDLGSARQALLQTEQGPQQRHAANHLVAQEAGRGGDQHHQNSFYGWGQMRWLEGMRHHDDDGLVKNIHREYRAGQVTARGVVVRQVAMGESHDGSDSQPLLAT